MILLVHTIQSRKKFLNKNMKILLYQSMPIDLEATTVTS